MSGPVKPKQPLDLKNMDVTTLLNMLLEQKLIVAYVILVGLAGFVVYTLVTQFFQYKNASLSQMNDLRHKLAVIETYKQGKKSFDDFAAALPKAVEENILVDFLSDFASQQGVEIVSFSPVTTTSQTYVDVTSVQMTIAAKEFKKLVSMMRALEQSPKAVRIENFSISPGKEGGAVVMTLNVSTLKIKLKS